MSSPQRHRAQVALLAAGVAVAGVAALAQSWGGWLDPIVDTGRDLYIPEQLRNGAKLYRDIIYYYPPLTPYLLAAITALTGSSLTAYTGIGIVVAALTALALWMGGRACGNPPSGFAAAVLFTSCSIAGRSTWGTNYLFPYSHAATFGCLFFVAFVGMLSVYLFARRETRFLILALALALAASWTKAEYAVFTAVVIVVAFAVHRLPLMWLAGYVGTAMASLTAATVFFRDSPAGRHWFFDNVAPSTLLNSPHLRLFYAEVTGVAHWPQLLARSISAAIFLAAVVVLIAAGERSTHGAVRVGTLVGAAIALVLLFRDDGFFRAWTVLQIVLLIFAIRRPREPLLLLLVASLCTTSRVFFNIVPVWYGFVFVVPLYLVIGYVFFTWLPQRGVITTRAVRVMMLVVLAVCVQSLGSAHITYGRKVNVLETDRGALRDASAGRVAAIEALRDDVWRFGIRSLVVMPEGLALNYLLRVPTPIAYYTFTPPEAADPIVEARILAELQAKRPEWIAFVPRDVREFGAKQFGVDYDQRVMAWIRANYAPADFIRRDGFSVLLLRRR